VPIANFRKRPLPPHNKGPSIWGWGLWYADKPGAWWGVGGWGESAQHTVTLGQATVLSLYKIAHSELTVDKCDNSMQAKALSGRGHLASSTGVRDLSANKLSNKADRGNIRMRCCCNSVTHRRQRHQRPRPRPDAHRLRHDGHHDKRLHGGRRLRGHRHRDRLALRRQSKHMRCQEWRLRQ
jgi:hypothetical protein